ncbi:MAG: hypothetical protein HDT44_03715 [Ruminococcaceae bacterium]|nr:hypothetical protein [Oscillospiraceae bacterium]
MFKKEMTPQQLRAYKMTFEERQIWSETADRIREYCSGLVPQEYSQKIEYHLSTKDYLHYAGYCKKEGYYYVSEGDRGELYCLFKNADGEKMQIFLLENILRDVGQKIELKLRDKEQMRWRFYEDLEKTVPGHIEWVENDTYVYGVKHDSRKLWFEFVLGGLIKTFGFEKVKDIVDEYTEHMNYWFSEKHWDFDREELTFVEIGGSSNENY